MKIILIALILLQPISSQSIDQPDEFCKNMDKFCIEQHAYCNPSNRTDYELIPQSSIMKKYILKLMNDLRNSAANGNITNFEGRKLPHASKMPTLIWDSELEWMAEALSKRCPVKISTEDLLCQFTPNHKRLSSVVINQITVVDKDEKDIYNHVANLIENWGIQGYSIPIASIYYYNATPIFLKVKEEETLETDPVSSPVNDTKYFNIIKEAIARKPGIFNFPMNDVPMTSSTPTTSTTSEIVEFPNTKDFAEIIKDSSSKLGCALYFCGVSQIIISRKFSILCILDGLIVDKLYQTSEVCGIDCNQNSKKYCCLCWNHPVKEPGTFYPKVIRMKGRRRCGCGGLKVTFYLIILEIIIFISIFN